MIFFQFFVKFFIGLNGIGQGEVASGIGLGVRESYGGILVTKGKNLKEMVINL